LSLGPQRAAALWLVGGLIGLLLQAPSPVRALDVPPLGGRVNDLAGLLDAGQRAALEQKLEAYERGSGHQFALLSVPSLDGDSLEDFSIRVVERWKLGKRGKDDGVLVLVAKQDRQMRIEVGYGLEGDIPDAIASRIVREVLQPAFKQGDFYGGLDQAFGMLMRAAGGESVLPPPRAERRQPGGMKLLFWGVIVLFWLLSGAGRGGRGRGAGAFLLGAGMGGGFGGGGRRGGGGGFGGGGGGFGGGGSSGGW
jgi:uncharacterized protein